MRGLSIIAAWSQLTPISIKVRDIELYLNSPRA
jgi:hypothetical protein